MRICDDTDFHLSFYLIYLLANNVGFVKKGQQGVDFIFIPDPASFLQRLQTCVFIEG